MLTLALGELKWCCIDSKYKAIMKKIIFGG